MDFASVFSDVSAGDTRPSGLGKGARQTAAACVDVPVLLSRLARVATKAAQQVPVDAACAGEPVSDPVIPSCGGDDAVEIARAAIPTPVTCQT